MRPDQAAAPFRGRGFQGVGDVANRVERGLGCDVAHAVIRITGDICGKGDRGDCHFRAVMPEFSACRFDVGADDGQGIKLLHDEGIVQKRGEVEAGLLQGFAELFEGQAWALVDRNDLGPVLAQPGIAPDEGIIELVVNGDGPYFQVTRFQFEQRRQTGLGKNGCEGGEGVILESYALQKLAVDAVRVRLVQGNGTEQLSGFGCHLRDVRQFAGNIVEGIARWRKLDQIGDEAQRALVVGHVASVGQKNTLARGGCLKAALGVRS